MDGCLLLEFSLSICVRDWDHWLFQFNIIKFLQKINRQKFKYVILGMSAAEEIIEAEILNI